jgi:hypothetical protein
MNYAKVYSQFIADRKSKEANLIASGEYTERHHIVPKKLGGTDCKSNIIFLSAEDHIRAHLLIAKIHGGSMWAPIIILASELGRRIPTRKAIRIAAIARKKYAYSISGARNTRYDHAVYHFKNDDLGELFCTRADFVEKIGLGVKNAAHFVINNKSHYKGWYLANQRPKIGMAENMSGIEHPGYKDEILTLEHSDGSLYTGTRFEVNTSLGISRPHITGIVDGTYWNSKGWGLPGWVKKKSDSLTLHSSKRQKKIVNLTTGVQYDSAKYAAKDLGLSYAGICKAAAGFTKHSGGYNWAYL